MKKQKWIWENEEYPNFKYDKVKLEPLLRSIAYVMYYTKFIKKSEDERVENIQN